MENPLVSVIIPTYNAGQYIKEALESVFRQTYRNIEVIVIDDGSSDNTREIVGRYIGLQGDKVTRSQSDKVTKLHVGVRYFWKENGGPASARNMGIKQAKGEYIAFLDADDMWLPEKLETQLEEMKDGIGLVGARDCDSSKILKAKDISYKELLIKNRFSNSSVMVKKECFGKVGLFDERPEFKAVEDWDMWLRISQKYTARFTDKTLVKIRVDSNGLCSPSNAGSMLNNEIAVLKKNISKGVFLRMRAYSYRYFCASWAYFVSGDRGNANRYIVKSFLCAPWSFLNKKQGGLMIRVILENILRCSIPVNRLTKPIFGTIYKIHVFIREFFIWFFKFIYFEPLFRSQCSKVGKRLWMEKLPYVVGKGKIFIGNFVRLSGKPNVAFNAKVFSEPKLIIGDHSFIGHAASFAIAKEIKVGNHCYISGGVTISDNDGHSLDYSKRRSNLPPEKDTIRPVNIGNDVWIGRRAIILKGVNIGDRAVIGAGTIVTDDVPPDCVACGNPSRIVKKLK